MDVPDVGTGRHSDFGRLPGESAGVHAASEAERVTQRVAGAWVDANARSRVDAGVVDTSYWRMGRAFLKAWDPDRALPETSAEMFVKRRAENSVVMAKLWQEAGANYGRNGSPIAEGVTLDNGTDLRPFGSTNGEDLRRQSETYSNYMQGKFNAGRSAHVLVDETTEHVKVSLVQSSGDIEVDRAALVDVRHALEQMRREHPEQIKRRKSLWAMRLQILINPPVPVIGVSFDEETVVPRLELPLGKRLFKHVELEGVYDDDPRQGPAHADAHTPE